MADPQAPTLPKKQTVVLLRWVLIIAFSYLLLLDSPRSPAQTGVVLLIVTALLSNLVIGRMPDAWLGTRVFDFSVVLFDAGWVTLGLLWAPSVSEDLFLLYFLVMFVASMGESLLMIVGSAVLVSVVYGATFSFHAGGDVRLATTALLRVPFLFVVALFFGYFVTEIRGRRAEATQARLREEAKSELLSAVSHDLRGPLGNADNMIALVLGAKPLDTPENRLLLLRAQVNVRRVGSLVANLLQAASLNAGQVNLHLAPLQLNDVVDDVFGLESGAAQLKDVALRKVLDDALPPIMGDMMQVGRILTNLVDNAIKYTERGGNVVIRTAREPGRVCVCVQDDGPGLSDEEQRVLFAPYRRVHLNSATPGTGLGLYIVKQLTEAQGGSVSVNSRPGMGSLFVVSFPVGAVPVPRRGDEHAAAAQAA